jgi:hypothetical protein
MIIIYNLNMQFMTVNIKHNAMLHYRLFEFNKDKILYTLYILSMLQEYFNENYVFTCYYF